MIKAGFTLRLMRSLFQALTIALLVRVLSTGAFGSYAFLIALSQIISVPAQLGLPQLVVREAAPLAALGDRAALLDLARWAGRMVLLASVLGIVIGIGVLVLIGGPKTSALQVALTMALVPMVAFINIRSSQLRGMGVGVRSQLSELVIVPTLFLAFSVACFAARPGFTDGIDLVLAGRVSSALVAAFFGQWLFRRALEAVRKTRSDGIVRPELASSSQRLRASIIFGASAGVYTLNGNMDLLMLTYLQGEEQTAIYRIAVLVAFSIAMVIQSLNTAISPTIALSLKLGSKEELQRIIAQQMPRLQLLVWPVLILFILFGQPMLTFAFGADYLASYAPMIILCLSACINMFFGPAGLLLNYSGNERYALKSGLLALTANIGFNLLLIPAHGASGAASATLISMLVFNFRLWSWAVKLTGVNTLNWLTPRR